jgi:hypothetical protein
MYAEHWAGKLNTHTDAHTIPDLLNYHHQSNDAHVEQETINEVTHVEQENMKTWLPLIEYAHTIPDVKENDKPDVCMIKRFAEHPHW